MPLRDIIEERVVSCSPETSIFDAAQLMKNEDVGAVLVLRDRKPVGIVTDRDIVLRCVCEKLDYHNHSVDRIMTKDVSTVTVEDGIQDVIDCMRDYRVRRVAVIDEQGNAIGLLSFGDVFSLLAREMAELSTNTAYPEERFEKLAA